jgi:ABC-2 type transport system permease protein
MKNEFSKTNELEAIYAVLWREITVFLREKPRVVSVLLTPLVWMILFGSGMETIATINGIEYKKFIFPGILIQTVLFSSVFYGVYLVWDKKIDVLKALLVSPIKRRDMFIGKVLGGTSIALIEAIVILTLGSLIVGLKLEILTILYLLLLVFVAAFILTSIGLAIGSVMDSPEGFQLIMSFVLLPLFFLSGALFPVSKLDVPLYFIALINPVTYMVDLTRFLVLNINYFSLEIDAFFLIILGLISFIVGATLFEKMRM